MIVDFKARFLFYASVGAAKVRQKIKLRIGAGFESGTHVNNMQRGNNSGYFTVSLDNFGYPVRMFTLQRRHQLGRRRFLI